MSKNAKSQWLEVGSVLRSPKDPSKSYIKIKKQVTLEPGATLMVEDPRDIVKKLAQRNIITEEAAEERLRKIPDYVLLTITLPPQQS